jgi:hypothetical protein
VLLVPLLHLLGAPVLLGLLLPVVVLLLELRLGLALVPLLGLLALVPLLLELAVGAAEGRGIFSRKGKGREGGEGEAEDAHGLRRSVEEKSCKGKTEKVQ